MEAAGKSFKLNDPAQRYYGRILETYISKGKNLGQPNQHCFLRRES